MEQGITFFSPQIKNLMRQREFQRPGSGWRGVSLRAIAAALEERGIPAARGGKWSAVQVSRLLEAARSPFDASAVAAVA